MTNSNAPLCFVLMPFDRKKDSTGREIDFNAVYDTVIAPAVRDAGLEPLRADEERVGGIIHKAMFERLVLCSFAVADLTAANANVFYELGVRHAVKPYATVLIFAEESGQLPFDVAALRALPYGVDDNGVPSDVATSRAKLTRRLIDAKQATCDSPLYQLLDNYPDIDHTKTDLFRNVEYAKGLKDRLADARKKGADAVREIEAGIKDMALCEAGVVIDIFLSYRAVKAWDEMIALVDKMSRELAATVLVQEQLAFALNRAEKRDRAEKVLLDLIARRGPSSETYGLLGRVYKDQWEEALKAGNSFLAAGFLEKAAEAYRKGFEADWRDAYPGINAVTLMELQDPPDPRRLEILPVVAYAARRRVDHGSPDYWDYATLLELAVLAKDEKKACDMLGRSLAAVRESWEPETTARNLRLIAEHRAKRGDAAGWEMTVVGELEKASET